MPSSNDDVAAFALVDCRRHQPRAKPDNDDSDSNDNVQEMWQVKEHEQAEQAAWKHVTVLCAHVVEFLYPVANARWHSLHPHLIFEALSKQN